MKRRALVSASLAAPFAAVFGEVQTYVTVDGARQIRLMVPELYTLDDQIGGEAVGQAAQWCLRKVDALLNQADYNDSAGRELQSAYGEMAEMAGWLHFDACRYDDARFFYGEALRAAQLADDLNLEVLTLASMNTLSRYLGRPREAIQLVQLAQRRASGWAPPRLATLLAAREAVCWAQLGDAAASRNAMHRAFHVFHPDLGEDEWWPDTDDEPTEAKGRTKFVICELAVRKPHRGKGIGTALMKTLLDGRQEDLATLCSNPAAPARHIYQRWGWQAVARAYPANIRPMDILLLPLRQQPDS